MRRFPASPSSASSSPFNESSSGSPSGSSARSFVQLRGLAPLAFITVLPYVSPMRVRRPPLLLFRVRVPVVPRPRLSIQLRPHSRPFLPLVRLTLLPPLRARPLAIQGIPRPACHRSLAGAPPPRLCPPRSPALPREGRMEAGSGSRRRTCALCFLCVCAHSCLALVTHSRPRLRLSRLRPRLRHSGPRTPLAARSTPPTRHSARRADVSRWRRTRGRTRHRLPPHRTRLQAPPPALCTAYATQRSQHRRASTASSTSNSTSSHSHSPSNSGHTASQRSAYAFP
ncbi:hypothetical protein C8R44DRAFT_992916, partial [Mycena epipterygia]